MKTVKSTKKTVTVKKIAKKSELALEVYDLKGVKKESLSLPKEIFSVVASPALLAQYVRVYMTNQRQGNASTKTRAQVNASTRKIYRQKGTGRARHGAKSAPIFVGGGVVFGPQSKEFSLKMSKKQKRIALFGSLTSKNKEGGVVGLATSSLKTEPKTKVVASFLKKLDLVDKKALFVVPRLEKNNLFLAARNLNNVKLVDVKSINPYIILNSDKVVFVSEAISVLKDHFLNQHDPSTSSGS